MTITTTIDALVGGGLCLSAVVGWLAYRVGISHGKQEARHGA